MYNLLEFGEAKFQSVAMPRLGDSGPHEQRIEMNANSNSRDPK